jgi:hypothetical protein
VFDRPKTVALSWGRDGQVTEWNPTFAGVALDLGLGVELCWPHSPEQKGAVENLVKWVKGSFFKQRRFLDEEDLLVQLREWLVEVNTRRPSRATNVIPEERMRDEQPRLHEGGTRGSRPPHPRAVGPTGMVSRHSVLMCRQLGIPGAVSLSGPVRIAGRYEHRRLRPPDKSV